MTDTPPRQAVQFPPLARHDLGDRVVEVHTAIGRIDMDNLREEIQRAGADSIWYGELSARAARRAGEAKLLRDTVSAQLRREFREQAVRRGDRATDQGAADYAQVHPDFQQAALAYLAAQEGADSLENLKFTMARKHSTCETLGPLLWQEERARHDGQPLYPPIPSSPLPGRRL